MKLTLSRGSSIEECAWIIDSKIKRRKKTEMRKKTRARWWGINKKKWEWTHQTMEIRASVKCFVWGKSTIINLITKSRSSSSLKISSFDIQTKKEKWMKRGKKKRKKKMNVSRLKLANLSFLTFFSCLFADLKFFSKNHYRLQLLWIYYEVFMYANLNNKLSFFVCKMSLWVVSKWSFL